MNVQLADGTIYQLIAINVVMESESVDSDGRKFAPFPKSIGTVIKKDRTVETIELDGLTIL